jgi:hypothetical protein
LVGELNDAAMPGEHHGGNVVRPSRPPGREDV